MSNEHVCNSQQDKLLEITIKILKDNNLKIDLTNKLDILLESIKTSPVNENDLMHTANACED